jgi:hypothetical protein
MQSLFRFIGLPSCLLEGKTAPEADLFPLGHIRHGEPAALKLTFVRV